MVVSKNTNWGFVDVILDNADINKGLIIRMVPSLLYQRDQR